jgi:hypothetical protein
MLCGDSAVSGPQVTTAPLTSRIPLSYITSHSMNLPSFLYSNLPDAYFNFLFQYSSGQCRAKFRKFPKEKSITHMAERNYFIVLGRPLEKVSSLRDWKP